MPIFGGKSFRLNSSLRTPKIVLVSNSTLSPYTVTIGDSWYGSPNPPYAGFYMGLYYGVHTEHPVVNMALGGQGLDYIRSKLPDIIAANPYVICISSGRNDFMNSDLYGAQSTDDAVVLAAYVAYFKTIIDPLKAALPGVAIIVETITERHTGAGSAPYEVRFNGSRQALNIIIRGWKSSGYIAQVVDIGGDPTIGAVGAMQINSDPISHDGLHLLEPASTPTSGHGIAYSIFGPAMDSLYASIPVPTEDLVSTFSIQSSPVTVLEGDSGTTLANFTVYRTGALSQTASVDWAVTPTGAHPVNAADFVGGVLPSGTLNFAALTASAVIGVPVQGDTTYEPDETFTVTLSNPKVTGKISNATDIGTITNDDVQPVGDVDYVFVGSASTNAGFAGAYTFPDVTLPASTTKYLMAIYGTSGRLPGTVKLTKGGVDTAATLVGSMGGSVQLWSADVSPGTYTPSMVTGGSAFAWVAFEGMAMLNAATLSGAQVLNEGNYNNPVNFPSTLTVSTGGIGVVLLSAGDTNIVRNDGSTQRASLTVNDSFGGTTILSFSTMTVSAMPSISSTGAGNHFGGVAVSVNRA